MRDSFETYFTGWVINSDLTADEKTSFASLVHEVGQFVNSNPQVLQDWKVYQLDEKRKLFLDFFYPYIESASVPGNLSGIVNLVKAKYPKK